MLSQLNSLRARQYPRWLRECLIFFGFLAVAAVVTWPWVTRMRDAVADTGDSYAFVWSLWWQYHQTFADPLNLYHGNIFFPSRYTLAFTEHGYGVALLCFPLLAAGLRPITAYSVGTYVAFACSGYAAFRLARTLTGSAGAGWIAGVFFAFVPYHFMFLTALPYLFTAWLPLLAEALVLFARARSWRRAAWLGAAFLMCGLTCVNWFLLALVPFGLTCVLLAVRHRIGWERAFWVRGTSALACASLLLLPFLWPYYKASKLYGFRRDAEEVTRASANVSDWLTAPRYNKLWGGMGSGLPDMKAPLFPGLLAPLLALAAFLPAGRTARRRSRRPDDDDGTDVKRRAWLRALDGISVAGACVAVVAAGFGGMPHPTYLGRFFHWLSADLCLLFVSLAFAARLCLSYPYYLRGGEGGNLVETLRTERRGDDFLVGLLWAVAGFVGSFGMNVCVYRVLYYYLPAFQSVRTPARAGMICYVGLAVLAGLGAARLARLARERWPRLKPAAFYAVVVAALMLELNAAPLPFVRGAYFPDEVSLQLRATEMRGGVVDLPSMPQPPFYSWHLSMLRAADHGRPVVFAAASFIPPQTMRVHELWSAQTIPPDLLDLLEQLPTSYVVVRHDHITPERAAAYSTFLEEAARSGRLRLVCRARNGDELYAVTKTEPAAEQSGGCLPVDKP